MNPIPIRRILAAAAAVVVLLLPAPGHSESLLDKESFASYGGTYLSDCGNLQSARVQVTERTITYIRGDLRLESSNLRIAPPIHGAQVPSHFRDAILSDTEAGQVRALLFRDDSGEWLELRGDNPALGALADPATTIRFRRCSEADLAAQPSGGATATAAAMLEDPKFSAAYKKALGKGKRDAWITGLEGPATPVKSVTIDNVEYQVLGACMSGSCDSRNMLLLYSPKKNVVYGKLYQAGTSTRLGSPPAAVALQIESLWKAQWRP